MQLFVCCADERGSMAACDACDVTPWLALAQHGALPRTETLNPCLGDLPHLLAGRQRRVVQLAQGVRWRGVVAALCLPCGLLRPTGRESLSPYLSKACDLCCFEPGAPQAACLCSFKGASSA